MNARPWMGFLLDLAALCCVTFLCWQKVMGTEVTISMITLLVGGRAVARGAAAGAAATVNSMRPPPYRGDDAAGGGGGAGGAVPPIPGPARAPMGTLLTLAALLAAACVGIVWARAHVHGHLWMAIVVATGVVLVVGAELVQRRRRWVMR